MGQVDLVPDFDPWHIDCFNFFEHRVDCADLSLAVFAGGVDDVQ